MRVSDDYESIHRDSHHVKNNNINDVVDDHEEALDALSPLSGIAAVGFLNRKQERSVVSEEVFTYLALVLFSHHHFTI